MPYQTRRIFLEALLVATLGVVAALVANVFSPRGLSLTRNYFPANGKTDIVRTAVARAGERQPDEGTSGARSPSAATSTSVKTGIALVTTPQALEFFRAPEYDQELIVFVDARNDRHYEAGHIPGAYQLDRYYPQNHLPAVLPACLNATRVVVYCAGGECEDSHFGAQLLKDAGVPAENLSVYAGGITEWEGKRLPIETGTRKSGQMRETKP